MASNPFPILNSSGQAGNNPFPVLNQQHQSSAPIIAPALAGVGEQLAKIGENLATPVAHTLDTLGISNNSEQGIRNAFNQNVYPFYNQYTNQNPTAALAGNVGGAILGSAPSLINGAGRVYNAATGFVNGYINSDPNAPTIAKLGNGVVSAGLNMIPGGAALATTAGAGLGYGYGAATGGNAGKDALIGAGVGLGTYAGGKGLVNIFRGAKAALMGPTDIANLATQNTLEATGKGLSATTPVEYLQQVDKLENAAKQVKNERYQARNDAADAMGINVNLTPIKDDVDFYLNNAKVTRTREGQQIIDKVNSGKPLTYEEAQQLSDLAGETAYTAYRNGDNVLNRSLLNVKNNIDNHIELQSQQSGGLLQALHNEADAFNKNVYSPLRDINAKQALLDHWQQGKTLNTIMDQTLKTPAAINAFRAANANGVENNAEQALLAAHVNATKAASTLNGQINPKTYADSLAKDLRDNPIPFQPVIGQLQALGNALDVAKQVGKVRAAGTEHSLGQKIGMGLGASLASGAIGGGATYYGTGDPLEAAKVAAGAFFIPKAIYMYGAGKLLQNSETRALLNRAATLSDQAPIETKNAINNIIAKKFQQQVQSIPPKLLPVFDSSNSQRQQ